MNPLRSFRFTILAAVAASVFCFGAAAAHADPAPPAPAAAGDPAPAPPAPGAVAKPAARREDVEPETLPDAKSSLKTARADRDKAEGDLAAEQAEHGRTKLLLKGALETCKAAQTDRDTAQGSLATASKERDDERAAHGKTREKLTLAEGLCAVRGIDPAQAVPAAAAPTPSATVGDFNAKLAAAKTPEARNAVLKEFAEAAKAGKVAKES